MSHAAIALQACPPSSSGPEKTGSSPSEKTTITVSEIVNRTGISRDVVYDMLEKKEIPAVHFGRKHRWIISRRAFEQWERTFGSQERSAPRLA